MGTLLAIQSFSHWGGVMNVYDRGLIKRVGARNITMEIRPKTYSS